MVNSLRKVDFSHPTGHYTWKKIRPPPLEKILGAPLLPVYLVICLCERLKWWVPAVACELYVNPGGGGGAAFEVSACGTGEWLNLGADGGMPASLSSLSGRRQVRPAVTSRRRGPVAGCRCLSLPAVVRRREFSEISGRPLQVVEPTIVEPWVHHSPDCGGLYCCIMRGASTLECPLLGDAARLCPRHGQACHTDGQFN